MTEENVFEPELEEVESDSDLEEVEPEAWPADLVDETIEESAGYEEVVENGDGNSGPDDFGIDSISEEDQTS